MRNEISNNAGATAIEQARDPQQRKQLIEVLQQSLYPGTQYESVEMVVDYCTTAGLDPMQKPVHIVPMNTKDPQTGQWKFRDVVMPGIGLYRIQADRSGTMAGISEPEFGELRTETFRDKNGNPVQVTYPEWCRVTARKLVGGQIVDFVAREYWLENYATDAAKSTAPNAMWKKRPRGQLAKCTEAQALRKGWPEIGAAPTAEEMEGKHVERDVTPSQSDRTTPRPTEPAALPFYDQEQFETNLPKWRSAIASGKKTADEIISMVQTKGQLTDQQKSQIRDADLVTEQGETE
jgi:phage recombination protein Bet